jgi:hypothetical protein
MKTGENDYTFRIWHDRASKRKGSRNKRRSDRTVCVLWVGDVRYVGVAQCSSKDQFVKDKGFHMAADRAHSRECGRPDRFPFMWCFHVEEVLIHEKLEFLKNIPAHLYTDERKDNESGQAVGPQFA